MFGLLLFLFASIISSSSESRLDFVNNNIQGQIPSSECASQYENLDKQNIIKMMDASSKFLPSGIIGGNFFDLGFYDECLSIVDEKHKIYGKYCLASIKLEDMGKFEFNFGSNNWAMNITQERLDNIGKLSMLGTNMSSLIGEFTGMAKFGVCMPDKCDSNYIGQIVSIKIDEAKCYTVLTNDDMDTSATIALTILYIFCITAICSTIYDMYIQHYGKDPAHPILLAFSISTNGKKLMKTVGNPDQLECLSGIKVFSMMWVIIGHTFFNALFYGTYDNFLFIYDWMDDMISMLILSATLSVDTFFTIGGMLTVYVFMKSEKMSMRSSFKKIPFLYLHRYLRLTPAFAIMVLIYGSGLIKYMGDGPKWYIISNSVSTCANNWWAALLYIQNYLPYNELCVVQSWYLSVDFQLFFFTPFLLIPLKKWPKYVIPSLYGLALIGMLIPFYVAVTDEFSGVGFGSGTAKFANQYYFVTHTRFATYIIGMIAGFYVYKLKTRKNPLVLNTGLTISLWIFSLAVLIICVFDGHYLVQNDASKWIDGIYNGFNRSAWSIATAIVVILCSTNHGGAINKFLSLPIFQIISKLSYSMYLTHYLVMLVILGSSRTSMHLSNFVMVCQFFVYFVICLAVSIPFCLIFESPMIIIEKIIFPVSRRTESNQIKSEKV